MNKLPCWNEQGLRTHFLLVKGEGINHLRKIGIALHLGLVFNVPTIGVMTHQITGTVEQGKIMLHHELIGFEVSTKEHANSLYIAPRYKITFGSVLQIIPKTIKLPPKIPEPLYLAHQIGKKKEKGLLER